MKKDTEYDSKAIEQKKYVRYKEGCKLYSMSQSKFERIAKDAGAIRKMDKMVLVNCKALDEYIESFKE